MVSRNTGEEREGSGVCVWGEQPLQRPGGKKRQPGAPEDLKEAQEGWGLGK